MEEYATVDTLLHESFHCCTNIGMTVTDAVIGIITDQKELGGICILQEGEAGHAAVLLLPVVGTTQRKSCLQVWLGSTQGWSLPVSLITASPQMHLVTTLMQHSCQVGFYAYHCVLISA